MLNWRRRGKVETFEMALDGLAAPVTVRRSPRARRFSLSVNEALRNGVLTIPQHASLEEAGRFLARNLDWLQSRLAAMPEPVPFAHGRIIPLRGLEHRICFTATARGRGAVWTRAPEASREVAADWDGAAGSGAPLPEICVAGEARHAPRRLKDWLKAQARKDLTARSWWHAERLGLKPSRITIRDQSTRWGSCSANGVLSYSWRVILAPPFVLDYLAAHEVAHLREMNHSKHFWALVRETMPRMEEGRRWLRTHGRSLHRYGVEEEPVDAHAQEAREAL